MLKSSKKEKILVIRYRFIGDTLLTVPFLRNLRRAKPDAQIDMLVAPVSGEIIEKCPYVDNFLYLDTTRKHRYENSAEKKQNFWHYVKLLREKQYDKAYVLKRSFSSAFLAFCAGYALTNFRLHGMGSLLNMFHILCICLDLLPLFLLHFLLLHLLGNVFDIVHILYIFLGL